MLCRPYGDNMMIPCTGKNCPLCDAGLGSKPNEMVNVFYKGESVMMTMEMAIKLGIIKEEEEEKE